MINAATEATTESRAVPAVPTAVHENRSVRRRRTLVGGTGILPGSLAAGRVRRIGAVALVGAFLVGASACGSNGRSAASPSGEQTASGPLPARIATKVRQTVRQFQDSNHTPGVLVGIW